MVERRQDEAWLRQQLNQGAARFVPLWRGRSLVSGALEQPRALLIQRNEPADIEELIFLGEFRGQPCFAMEITAEAAPQIHPQGEFHELRMIAGQLDRDEAGLLGYARALILWREKHRYCGRCGSPTRSINGGHAVKCSNAECAQMQFPRLDPAIIVLVTDGERVLLGRQASWAPGRYSTLAGYVETGESLEEAVAREVREESGIEIEDVQYHSSQPWPFPSSLMLGFIARARTTDIHLNDMELEDARWFSRADLLAGACSLPPVHAISFRLIESWYDEGAAKPMRTEPSIKIASFTQRT
jgi:NAD+ diphosphatase